jgi:type I restriction enzyme, S subunit
MLKGKKMYKEEISTKVSKSNISINISREHSRFVPEVEDCFKDTGFPVSASYIRLSAQELPMQILIFVGGSIAGGVIYDLLKSGIKKALSKFKNASIVLEDQEGILFAIREGEKVNPVVVSDKRAEFAHIKALNDLMAHLNSMNQSGWSEKRLGELTTKIGSGATPRGGQEAYKKEGISLIRSQNVNDFSFSYKGLAFIDEQQARKLNNVTVQKEDVLLNITGDSVARVCKPPKDVLPARVNQHVAIIRPDKKKLDSNFLQYYLLNPIFKKHMLLVASNGATRNAITKGNIEDFKLCLPANLKEQKAIAAVLTSFDDKIELLRKQNQTLEETAQTLFKEWFVDYRFPEVGKMVDSELGQIPEGWKVGKLEDLLEIKYGKDHKHLGEGDIPVYGSGGIMRYANKALYSEQSILIPRKGTLSNLFYVNKPFWSVDTMFYSKIRKREFGIFSFLLLKTMNLASMDVGSAVPSLTAKILNELKVVVADNKVMKIFNDFVSVIFEKMEFNKNQIQTLTKLRDSLLPKLMSGEVRVKM